MRIPGVPASQPRPRPPPQRRTPPLIDDHEPRARSDPGTHEIGLLRLPRRISTRTNPAAGPAVASGASPVRAKARDRVAVAEMLARSLI